MALVEENVRVGGGPGVTGGLSVGGAGAAAPSAADSALTNYKHLGYANEDGVTISFPAAGDPEVIRAWQNGAQVRVISTPSDEVPTIQLTLIEWKKSVIEAVFGVTVDGNGGWVYDPGAARSREKYVLDVIDGEMVERIYVPAGEVTEIGDLTYQAGNPVGYQITISCYRDSATGGSLKVFSDPLPTTDDGPLDDDES